MSHSGFENCGTVLANKLTPRQHHFIHSQAHLHTHINKIFSTFSQNRVNVIKLLNDAKIAGEQP